MEELDKCKISTLEDFSVLQKFVYMFKEILGWKRKGGIDFSINLVPRDALISKFPYRMSTSKLK